MSPAGPPFPRGSPPPLAARGPGPTPMGFMGKVFFRQGQVRSPTNLLEKAGWPPPVAPVYPASALAAAAPRSLPPGSHVSLAAGLLTEGPPRTKGHGPVRTRGGPQGQGRKSDPSFPATENSGAPPPLWFFSSRPAG